MLREHELSGRFLFGEYERLIQVIEKLAHHYRWRDLLVMNGRASDITDQEFFLRGKKRFKKGVTVVLPGRRIAGARRSCHEVELRRLRPARKGLIVDSEKADHASRNAADRFQRAKGHVPLKELSSLLHGRELLGQVMTHYAKIDVRSGVGGIPERSQLIDGCSQKADIPKFFFAGRVEKLFDCLQERFDPVSQRARVLEVLR